MNQKTTNKYKTGWNFGLFYKSDNDPQIDLDIKKVEKSAINFEKKWKKNSEILSNLSLFKKALEDYEKFFEMPEFSKPYNYFYLRKDINTNNKKATAEISKIQSRLTAASNKILFFELMIGKIDKNTQKLILKNKDFKKYYYFLQKIWTRAKHDLSEKEEQILNLLQDPARDMWIRGVDNILSNQEVEHKGKKIPTSQARAMMFEIQNTEERKELNKKLNQKLIEASDFAEAEINAVYTKKKIEDELRGFKNAYDLTILNYQNDEKTVFNLVNTVTKNFKIAHEFFKLKSKILGVEKLDYSARGISIGKIKKEFTFENACEILSSAFGKVDKKYQDMFESFLKEGKIDLYPKVGKTGGAYCSGGVGLPTFVLHNYTNSYNSVNTLAHEMGHAFHTELSKSQPAIYQGYTMSVAETASTLFENFVFDEMFERLSDDEKIIALHDRINSSISTIFRQIACFNFENDLHKLIRSEGFASKEKIAELMNKHMKSYLGPVFELDKEDGYFFVNWSHIRNFFYVYSYAYGELISMSLYEKYKSDKSFMKKIETFLSAGGSKSPYMIFKDIGIDTTKPDFFLGGLKKIESDIKSLKKLISNK